VISRQSVFHRQASRSSLFSDLLSLPAKLGQAIDDIPPHHHEIILVSHVVAVDEVSADEISELKPYRYRTLTWQSIDIPAHVIGHLI
jgi:hypothetical protein